MEQRVPVSEPPGYPKHLGLGFTATKPYGSSFVEVLDCRSCLAGEGLDFHVVAFGSFPK